MGLTSSVRGVLLCLLLLVAYVPQVLLAPAAVPGVRAATVTLVVLVLVLGDPMRGVGLAYFLGMYRALTSTRRHVALLAVVLVATLAACAELAPSFGGVARTTSEVVAAVVGIPVVMAVLHLVAVVGAQADAALAHGRLIAQSGLDIARAADEGTAHRVSRTTALALLAGVPGASSQLLPAGTAAPDGPGAVWQDFPVPITPDDQRVVRVVSERPLKEELARALAIVATQLALALAKSALTRDLARRAGEDPLTGLLNRRRLDEVMAAALGGAEGPAAVTTLDLDRSKAVNDTHGHAVGDEFLVLLTGEHAAQRAPDLAERLVAAIAAPFEVAGRTVAVGVSVGVAVAAPGQGPDEVMLASDAAMYRAEQGGRGRSVLAQPV